MARFFVCVGVACDYVSCALTTLYLSLISYCQRGDLMLMHFQEGINGKLVLVHTQHRLHQTKRLCLLQ